MGKTDTNTALTQIPDWTEQDYVTTSAPFDWLYQYKDNKFVMSQLREQIKTRAGAVGVKNFVSLWNNYLESKKPKVRGTVCNMTEFDGQPVQLVCSDYVCNDYGIVTYDRFGFETVVCPHPIMPVKRLINVDTGETKLEIAFKRGSSWRYIVVDKTALASSQKIIELAGQDICVNSENARALVKYIADIESANYDCMEQVNSVGRLGWIRGHGFSPYSKDLTFDGNNDFRGMYNAVRQEGDGLTWLECVKNVRSNSLISRIMLAASFASVLIEPCRALPFFVHIWGGTEAGKTLGLMLATSVWADPCGNVYMLNFDSTKVGLEVSAGFCNSLPLCVDELQIAKERQNFDTTIYTLTEGSGRTRGTRSGGKQRTPSWRNSIITTGEMPISNPNSGGGAINRVIEIDCKGEQLFTDPIADAEVIHNNFGFAGCRFVNKLQEDENIEIARELYRSYTKELSTGASTAKQVMAAALLLTADTLAENFVFEDGLRLKASDIEPFLTSKDDVDQNKRAYNWIFDFIASNPSRFDTAITNGEVWGTIDDDYVYIIKSVFDAKMHDQGFNSASFLSWAKRRDLIVPDAEGRNTKNKRIGNSSPRCVFLKRPHINSENTLNPTNLTEVHNEADWNDIKNVLHVSH
jgi:hypothetical protein